VAAPLAMAQDVWSERSTSPDAVEAALRELLRERHAANRALAPARVLNLVVVVDGEWKGEISNRLERVGRYHASRTILCAVQEGKRGLDARATISYDEPVDGGIGPIRERVDIDLGPEQLTHLETIVDPLLVAELPTMLWSPHGHEEAVEALLGLTDVILVDSDARPDDHDLIRAAQLGQSAYVVDLAWLRTMPWRERLAASFDIPVRAGALPRLQEVTIRHHHGSLASASLLAGWLASRLGWETEPISCSPREGCRGLARWDDERRIAISLVAVDQEVPGLAGVTVAWDGERSLALDRGPGGLHVRERWPGGEERSWQVLGASRGEGRILGEGVRQALLRDPTYPGALDQALALRGSAVAA
jgi:glucose-6-phosphate dehydrogenase assembly protein OpcA